MTYLLEISALMALLWQTHEHHDRVLQWEGGENLAVCPLTELGFLRISTQETFGLTVEDARRALKHWRENRKPGFVACDLPALDSDAPSSGKKTTDFYLASLAERKGMQFATLDERIAHRAAFLIPKSKHPPTQTGT